MKRRPPKPSSIWITQFLLAIGGTLPAIVFLSARMVELVSCLVHGALQCITASNLLDLAGSWIFLAWVLLAIWGLQKRTRYGKWLAIIFLLCAMVISMTRGSYFQLIYQAITSGMPLPTPPYDCWQSSAMKVEQDYCGYSSYVDLGLRTALDILFPASLLGFLAIRVRSGLAATRFFES